jgi:L-fuconolactonase
VTLPDRICDPHHHLWQVPGMEYSPSDLLADIATVPEVMSTVFVECDAWYRNSGPEHLRVIGETEWVVANCPPIVAGIVGAGDLRLGALTSGLDSEMLDAHLAAGKGRFRGIRQRATWDADVSIRPSMPYVGEGLLTDPWFRRGFHALQQRGLTFDAWMYFPQLPDLVDLAHAHPDSIIVLNHLGGPITLGPYHDREATHAAWRRLLTDVAACPNVMLKVGGHGMPMYLGRPLRDARANSEGLLDTDGVVELWGDAIRFCIDTFSPERCMFESNFPVDKLTMSYATLWAAFDTIASDYSPDERRALFHDTAVRTYRLSPEGGDR